MLLGATTVMRLGELLSLTWRAVDLKRNEITVEAQHEKTSRGRVVPIGPVLRQVLVELRATRRAPNGDGSDRVFRSRRGGPLTAGIRRHAYESAVRRAISIPEHKRERLTFHALRHTAAFLMTQQGVPPLELMKIMVSVSTHFDGIVIRLLDGFGWLFPVPVPTRCRESGNGNGCGAPAVGPRYVAAGA